MGELRNGVEYRLARSQPAFSQCASRHELAVDRADLFEAISNERLNLVLQPLIDLRTGRVLRFEALSRWHHPVFGEIEPRRFVPLAERSGLITPLTLLVLRRAAETVNRFPSSHPNLAIAINVARETLHWTGFPKAVRDALHSVGCAASAMRIEITERTLKSDPARSRAALAMLRSTGVRVDLDHFGADHSSLEAPADYPLDALKIDRSFVTSMAKDGEREAIVRATIGLAHRSGLEAVAEGVEDRKTWELLLALGCDAAQGYHIARPLPQADVRDWIAGWEAGLAFIQRSRIGGTLLR